MEKKKNIVTALDDNTLNELIKQKTSLQVLTKDISYQEGLFEIIEENKQIDIMIINQLLPGKDDFIEVINKIKKMNLNINIFVIIEKEKENILQKLKDEKIENIFFSKENWKEKIIEKLNKSEKPIVIKGQIKNKEKKEEEKVFFITGTSGVGKSVFCINLAHTIANRKNKVLIIDLDFEKNNIHKILGRKLYKNKKPKQIKNIICKYNKNIYFISEINKNNIIKAEEAINEFKKTYNTIIIDTGEKINEYNKIFAKKSEVIFFLIEANITEINKSKSILEKQILEWKIQKNKINIIFNKYNKNSIKIFFLKKIFEEFNIAGKIKYSDFYNLIINKNIKTNKKIKKEYKKIYFKIFNKKMKLNRFYIKKFKNIINKIKINK